MVRQFREGLGIEEQDRGHASTTFPVANVAARAAAEASAESGHDLFGWNGAGGAHLYRKFLVDVTSLVEATEKKYGKVSTIGRQIGYNQDDKTWSAFPDFYINFPSMYRKSMWDEIGMKPDTWDNVRIGGAKLKAKGHPVGISLGHSNDPNTTWRGLLWSFGGALQDETARMSCSTARRRSKPSSSSPRSTRKR